MGPDDLIGDAGPEFDPAAEPASSPLAGALDGAGGEDWKEARVRGLLNAKGELVHGVLAVDKSSTEWRYTAADLDVIAPALTRILNRYDATRAAAAAGDELVVAVGFAGYAARSYGERRLALQLRALAAGEQPQPEESTAAAAAAVDWQPATRDDVEHQQAFMDAAEWPDQGDAPPIAPTRR